MPRILFFFSAIVLLFATLGYASPLKAVTPTATRTWPANNQPQPAVRMMSNAERIKRGLAPGAPKRLYDPARVHSAPKARLSSTPNSPPSDGNGYYDFQGCYDNIAGSTNTYPITASTDQSAVNQCTNLVSSTDFALIYNSGESYSCYNGAYGDGSSTTCTTANYATYSGGFP